MAKRKVGRPKKSKGRGRPKGSKNKTQKPKIVKYEFDDAVEYCGEFVDGTTKFVGFMSGIFISIMSLGFFVLGLADKTIPISILTNKWLYITLGIFIVVLELLARLWVSKIPKKYNKITFGATAGIKTTLIIPSAILTAIVTGIVYGISGHFDKFMSCLWEIAQFIALLVALLVAWLVGIVLCIALAVGLLYGFVWLNNKWLNKVLNKK